jgi:hypothetical protein
MVVTNYPNGRRCRATTLRVKYSKSGLRCTCHRGGETIWSNNAVNKVRKLNAHVERSTAWLPYLESGLRNPWFVVNSWSMFV